MLRTLRIRLSLLYLAASLGLVGLIGAATYGLLALYFLRSTDLALQVRMAQEFQSRNLALPAELSAAVQAWAQGSSLPFSFPSFPSLSGEGDENDGEDQIASPAPGITTGMGEDRYDGDLAAVFVPSDPGVIAAGNAPVINDPAAVLHARQTGSDLRTIRLEEGARLRLLTYTLTDGSILQAARLLSDQDRLLASYLTGLLLVGGAASLFLALASWALAGRSIKPAQQAWDQQQAFISNASHELRAPLTLLRASADFALRSDSAAERESSLQDILAECDYMNRLVEDLLLLSRLDARRLNLQLETISVTDLVGETCRQVEKLAQAKGVQLSLEAAPGTLRGDRVRLRQVLLILLDNALRFTPAGGRIHLSAQKSGNAITLQVADSGSGIAAEHLSHLFERFYQVPGQPSEGRGNGLGLSIARGLVEAHHGRISIASRPGQGTTVQIVLPAA